MSPKGQHSKKRQETERSAYQNGAARRAQVKVNWWDPSLERKDIHEVSAAREPAYMELPPGAWAQEGDSPAGSVNAPAAVPDFPRAMAIW